MRIYQSSLSTRTLEIISEFAPDVKVNLLRSFALNDNETFHILNNYRDNINSVILDSGVWSKKNNPIKFNHTVDDYIDFLKKYSTEFDFYFNYDEDFDEKERDKFGSRNESNQKKIEDAGLKPIPVLHLLDSDVVQFHVEQFAKYPMVAIGSNGLSDARFASVVSTLNTADIKVHAFKLGSADKLRDLPVFSADCSSHAQWTKAGRCVIYDNIENKDTAISFRPFNKRGEKNEDFYRVHPQKDDFIWFVEEVLGIEVESMVMDSNCRTFSNSIYFWWLERYLTMHQLSQQGKKYQFDENVNVDDLLNLFEPDRSEQPQS